MNYLHLFIYVLVCIGSFMVIFCPFETFNVLFEKVYNDVKDINDPNYTGGVSYVFKLFNLDVFMRASDSLREFIMANRNKND